MGNVLESAQAEAELVIVAGLSGAGKTTFLRQLKANGLPKRIAEQLPTASHSWSIRNWPKRTELGQEHPESGSKGLVLHHIVAPRDRLARQLEERSFENDRLSRLILGLINPRHVSVPGILKLPVLSLLEFRQKKLKAGNARHKIARILSRLDAYTHHPERLEQAQDGLKEVLRLASEAGIEIKQVCIEPAPVAQNEPRQIYQWRQLDG